MTTTDVTSASQHLTWFQTQVHVDVRPGASVPDVATVELTTRNYRLSLSLSDEQAAQLETKLRAYRESRAPLAEAVPA